MFHAENLDKFEDIEFLPPLKENCLLLKFFSGPDSLQDKTLSSNFLNSLFPLSLNGVKPSLARTRPRTRACNKHKMTIMHCFRQKASAALTK